MNGETRSVEARDVTGEARPAWLDPLLYLLSAACSFFAHNIFVYTMVTLSRSLTGSDAVSGALFFFTFAPIIVLTFLAGVVADQRSRRRLVVVTQWCVSAVTLLAMALLGAGVIGPGHEIPLFGVAVLYGFFGAFAIPARLSLVGNVARGRRAERMMVGVNVLQFVGLGAGPGVAGFVLTHGTWTHLFAIVSVLCFLSGAFALLLREPYPQTALSAGGASNTMAQLKAGLRYAFSDGPLVQLFVVTAVIGLCMFGPFQVLVPEFGRSVLHLGEQQRGLFMFPFGFGLLLGGGAAGALVPSPRRGWLVVGSTMLSAAGFLLLPTSGSVTAGAILLLFVGAFGGLASALLMASVNSLASDVYRGRVMSVFSWMLTGTSALGGAVFGGLARATSVPTSILAAGAVATFLALGAVALCRDLRVLGPALRS